MKVLLAILLIGVAVVALSAYGGTPHYGPTTTCGPITVFNRSYTIAADCRVISFVELAAALISFLFAIFLVLAARPHRPPQ